MDKVPAKRNQLSKWAQDFVHHVRAFVGAAEVREVPQLRDDRLLAAPIEELKATVRRLEDHVRMFHADCGGIVVGELGKPFTCAHCGKEMRAFASAQDEVVIVAARISSDKLRWLDSIRKRAYQIWLERQANGTVGSAETDWEQAERGTRRP